MSMWAACAALVAIAALLIAIGLEPGSALRHLYVLPALWAALCAGAPAGAAVGLFAGLLQAPVALPAVEQLGLTAQTIDGLISLGTPLAIGWGLGALVDRSRERAARLRAVLDIHRAMSRERPLEETLGEVAERIRTLLRADRIALLVGEPDGRLLQIAAPRSERFDERSAASITLRSGRRIEIADLATDPRVATPSAVGAAPARGFTLAIDAGSGPAGVLALERAGDWPSATSAAADEFAIHLALAIENVRLTLRQRQFARELEEKIAAATERLRALDEAKSEFLSVVAHELRTPLTALEGFSELLLTRALSSERAMRFIGHIHAEASRLGRIVTELLDLSRIESGRALPLTREDVDLAELVERNIELFAMEHPNHRFEWMLSTPVPRLRADRDAVDRMLKNLLSNAVKYSPRGGRVAVTVEPVADRPGMIEVSVEDDGVGISAEDLPRVFDRYVRIANSETAMVRGLGLGLCLVKALAEAHGGAVHVESVIGKGTTFRLRLPA